MFPVRCARATVLVPRYFLYYRLSMSSVCCYLLIAPIVFLGELKEVKDEEGN